MGIKESYTSASVFPIKLLHNKVIDESGKIIPLHIQLIPTNACNLSCDFCSCSDRDKEKSLSLERIIKVLVTCANKGTKAMTITGGGEPLLHRHINEMIDYAKVVEIETGLVTNGIQLQKLKPHDNLSWCRISSADDRMPAFGSITKAIKINPETDWAFSHVVSRAPNYKIIRKAINYANSNGFTHVRLVSDLCDLDNVPPMDEIAANLKNLHVDDRKVIYQGRKNSTKGTKDCYISLLKPVIAPEGIFPCCGAQYAIRGQKKTMEDIMSMGKIEYLGDIFNKQWKFNGEVCEVCYYSQYNTALKNLLNKPEHSNFV